MTDFSGTGVAVVTPFDQNRQVDYMALRNVIRNLISGKVEYLVALGTTGESVTLDDDEIRHILDVFFEESENKIPIVVGVGGNNTSKLCKQAKEVQANYAAAGLLSVSPYYNKPTQEGIIAHFKSIASASDLPIILYNVPGRTASNMTSETTLHLAHEVNHIVAVKEASGNLEQGMEIIAGKPEGFQVLSGDDMIGLAQVFLGYQGVISVIGNACPFEFSEMIRLGLAGEIEAARKYQYQLLRLMQLNFVEGNPAGVKRLMSLRDGLCEPWVRLPLIEGK